MKNSTYLKSKYYPITLSQSKSSVKNEEHYYEEQYIFKEQILSHNLITAQIICDNSILVYIAPQLSLC